MNVRKLRKKFGEQQIFNFRFVYVKRRTLIANYKYVAGICNNNNSTDGAVVPALPALPAHLISPKPTHHIYLGLCFHVCSEQVFD